MNGKYYQGFFKKMQKKYKLIKKLLQFILKCDTVLQSKRSAAFLSYERLYYTAFMRA